MQKAREVSFPGANLEVKIVLAVALFPGLVGGRDCKQNDRQTAQKQTSPQMVKRAPPCSFERDPLLGEAELQCDLPDSSLTRTWSVIQLTSQVLPPSSEKDCSKCGESVSVFDQINRTRIDLLFGPEGSVS